MTSPPDDILDLLTAYALGAIAPDEIARANALLEEQPELRATLAELRAAADMLPYGLPEAEPPAELRQRVLDYATGRSSSAQVSAPRRLSNRMRGWMLGLSGIAAVAVLAAAIGWAQLIQTRSQLAQSQTELTQAQTQVADAQMQLAQSQAALAQIQGQVADAQELIATLTSDSSSAAGAAIVRTRSGSTVLIAQLPPLQPGRVYQLWRIQGSNPPAPAGIFHVSAQGYGTTTLQGNQQPQAGEIVAVTEEPDGGSPGPTTDVLIKGSSNA
jgi:anti-sigma-K factor RskA